MFVSPLGSLKPNKQGVRSPPLTNTHRHARMHARTNTSRHTCSCTLQCMGSLIERPVYFGCEFWCPAGTWDWWTGRAVQQTADPHTETHTRCARLRRLPATSHKERQRRKGRTKCVWEGETARVDEDVRKWRKRVVIAFKKGWNSWVRGRKATLIRRRKWIYLNIFINFSRQFKSATFAFEPVTETNDH